MSADYYTLSAMEDRLESAQDRITGLEMRVAVLQDRLDDLHGSINAAQNELFRDPPNVRRAIEIIDDINGEWDEWYPRRKG